MASKYFYFDLDLHGVGFYEEEITIGSEQGTMAEDDVPVGEGAEDLLYDLFPQILTDHKHTTTYTITMPLRSRREPCEVQMEKPANLAGNFPQSSHHSRRRHYKLTHGQLRELERVFRKNPYPDALKIHELAEILHVNECIVKVSHPEQAGHRACDIKPASERGKPCPSHHKMLGSMIGETNTEKIREYKCPEVLNLVSNNNIR